MSEQPPSHDVFMRCHDLARAPQPPLPDGYQMRLYRDGDVQTWVRVQQAAEQFIVPTAETFARSMPGEAAYLAERVMFLVGPSGAEVGTITAWSDPLDGHTMGRIHWVAIVPAAQGRGLAKPMLGAACAALRAQGFAEAWLETNTRRVPAINLYLQFGFAPYPRNEADREAWRAAAPHLKMPIE